MGLGILFSSLAASFFVPQPDRRTMEIITTEKYQILTSLKTEYEKQLGSTSKYYIIILNNAIGTKNFMKNVLF